MVGRRNGRVDLAEEALSAARTLEDFGVRPRGASEMQIQSLSGGNQQKVLFARALAQKPKVLVLIDPTAGVDIGARAELHDLLRHAAAAGAAIVLGSSDFEEVAGISSRVLVARDGAIGAELEGDEIRWDRLFAEAHGGHGAHDVEHVGGLVMSAVAHADGIRNVAKLAWSNSLALLFVLVVAIFSLIRPESYFTIENAQMIASTNAVLAILALAAVPPLVAGQFDLSIGFQLALSQSLCAGMIIFGGVPPILAGAIVLVLGAIIGLINGLLIARGGLNAFITTLATGIVVEGFTQLYTDGSSIFGAMPGYFLSFGRMAPLGVPLALVYVLLVAAAMGAVYRYTDWGRQAFAVGGNPRAAALIGIGVNRIVIQSYMLSGILSALAGIVSASILGSSNPNIGMNYLLPAFAAVFLGAAPAGPGRFNAWGTVIAVYALAAGIAGLQQLGAAFYVEQFFNGGALLAAIALAKWMAGRALAQRR